MKIMDTILKFTICEFIDVYTGIYNKLYGRKFLVSIYDENGNFSGYTTAREKGIF